MRIPRKKDIEPEEKILKAEPEVPKQNKLEIGEIIRIPFEQCPKCQFKAFGVGTDKGTIICENEVNAKLLSNSEILKKYSES